MDTRKLKCTRACQVPGFGIVKPEAVIALPAPEIDARIEACFVDAETGAAVTATRSHGLDDLTKEELQTRAEQLGISFGSRMTKAELISLIVRAEANVTERA